MQSEAAIKDPVTYLVGNTALGGDIAAKFNAGPKQKIPLGGLGVALEQVGQKVQEAISQREIAL